MRSIILILVATVGAIFGCQNAKKQEKTMNFIEDVEFLRQYKDVIVLQDDEGQAKVALIADYQGRVMTSTATGDQGLSFGWINRELIASGERKPHINVFGGEDRFWLGPEGGQFSIFFKNGDPFDLEHWQTPAAIDWEAYDVVSVSADRAVFSKDIHLKNYSNTEFDLKVMREIRLLSAAQVSEALGMQVPASLNLVGFESVNTIRNTGENPWKKDTGLLSIWILGMFNPSPGTTVVIPFRPGPESELGAIVNDAYFGKVPSDRLLVKDAVLFFKGDGQYRSKIGVSPLRCKPVLGSYDAANQALTIVQFNFPEGVTDYVNSMWEMQEDPYGGDVVNSYNDGPPEPGARPLGPFYELETSSPAAELQPGESLTHIHRTIHLIGPENELNAVTIKTLSVTIEEIKKAFQ